MKTFTVAGTSVENDIVKFRVANDLNGRITMLERCNNTEIQLIELPEPMTKQAAAEFLLEQKLFTEHAELFRQVAAKTPIARAKPAAKPNSAPAKPAAASTKPTGAAQEPYEDDGFVEPTDEAVQVSMCRAAVANPGLSAQELYDLVTAPPAPSAVEGNEYY